jgi:hypothetical protein
VADRFAPGDAVRTSTADLFGDGDHAVTVELWEDYLEPADPQGGTP